MGLMAVRGEGSPAARPRHPGSPTTPTQGSSAPPGYQVNFSNPLEFILNSNASFGYTVLLDAQQPTVPDLSFILLQTSAKGSEVISDANTYKVADITTGKADENLSGLFRVNND